MVSFPSGELKNSIERSIIQYEIELNNTHERDARFVWLRGLMYMLNVVHSADPPCWRAYKDYAGAYWIYGDNSPAGMKYMLEDVGDKWELYKATLESPVWEVVTEYNKDEMSLRDAQRQAEVIYRLES